MATIVGEPMPIVGRRFKRQATHDSSARWGGRAFDDAFNRHWPRVLAVATRLVGDADEAEDLALDVFCQLHRQPPVAENDVQLAGWLYRVTANAGLNALRARRRRNHYEEIAGRMAPEIGALPLASPAAALEQRERREAVRRALGEISPRAAQLLVLRQAGLSYAELAAVAGVAPGSVGTLLARAEREFAGRYDEEEGRAV